jgi:hypothetical protein
MCQGGGVANALIIERLGSSVRRSYGAAEGEPKVKSQRPRHPERTVAPASSAPADRGLRRSAVPADNRSNGGGDGRWFAVLAGCCYRVMSLVRRIAWYACHFG